MAAKLKRSVRIHSATPTGSVCGPVPFMDRFIPGTASETDLKPPSAQSPFA
jgi:hypothetical protein